MYRPLGKGRGIQEADWPVTRIPPEMESDGVHLWRSRLDLADSRMAELASYLSPDETDRARRFHLEKHRRRFIAGRGILRRLLGTYLELNPRKLRFSKGRYGKPFLPPDAGSFSLSFNMSRSKDLALFAVARSRRIGIDMEKIRPLPDAEPIARSYFHPDEFSYLRALPEEDRTKGFFDIWTRKEAYLKALGRGLGGLDAPDSPSLMPEGADSGFIKIPGGMGWTIVGLGPAPLFSGAVAAEGAGIIFHRFSL
ncbi:MAG: 4'-phosphopantetheinyl transferase family protein [Thermodesulfobacteriota bacterium]